MANKTSIVALLVMVLFISCKEDPITPGDEPSFDVPEKYSFERNGASTVDFTEPTIHTSMAMELLDVMYDYENSSLDDVMNVWNNENSPFSDQQLNDYNGNLRGMVASSEDLFQGGNATSEEIRTTMEDWMRIWVEDVFPNVDRHAEPGVAGQIADWIDTRLVPGDGMEYLQVVSKALNGALFMDQICNNWLSTAKLDEGNNRADNDNGVLVPGKNYTAMEFAWDQAYGYVYGLSKDYKDPMATIGLDDLYLNKYVKLIDNDDDFEGIAQTIFDAYKKGRAAIVAKDYEERDKQADIVKREISNIMIIRTAFYLQSGINEYNKIPREMGAYLHDTGEGNGFVYALQFSKNPETNQPYFTRQEAINYYNDILDDGPNGLWDTKMSTLESITNDIAARMPWTAEMAKDF